MISEFTPIPCAWPCLPHNGWTDTKILSEHEVQYVDILHFSLLHAAEFVITCRVCFASSLQKDCFHMTSHHFWSAILVYHSTTFDCVIVVARSIPTSKMDSKEKETKCQIKSGVEYPLPISDYAKQLDLPV